MPPSLTRILLSTQSLELLCPRCQTYQTLSLRWYGSHEQSVAIGQSVPHDCPGPLPEPTDDYPLPW